MPVWRRKASPEPQKDMSRDLSMEGSWDLSTWASKNARSRCRWVAIAILLQKTERPGAAPRGAEGRDSWADMVHCFQQSLMRECIQYDTCWSNQYGTITRKIVNYFLVCWKAQGIPKGDFGCVLARKEKRGKKSQAGSIGPRLWFCIKSFCQPRDAARQEECSDLDEKS